MVGLKIMHDSSKTKTFLKEKEEWIWGRGEVDVGNWEKWNVIFEKNKKKHLTSQSVHFYFSHIYYM